MKHIQEHISAQLDANSHGIQWVKIFLKGASQKETKRRLIQNRINLRRIQYAAEVNAGAAIFGASQVGKSYMSNYLLATETSPTRIYDTQGASVGFLSSVNPTGNGKEATALITRFSTKNLCGANPDYPYQVVMLSPVDIILVIVDSYFNDIDGQIVPDKEAVFEEINRLTEKYAGSAPVQDVISIDSIYEIMEYFNGDYLSKRPDFRENLISAGYFESLGNLINAIPVEDWANVFGFFWGHHPVITEIFTKLIKVSKSLGFSKKTFVSFDAINKQEGTILHVDRIYELVGIDNLSEETKATIEMARVQRINVLTENGNVVRNVSKDTFCALAQEVDFTIADPTNPLSAKEIEEKKPVLSKMDVLDFPGARSREEISVSNLGYETAVTMVVRGKVAYLFNKYSAQYLISSLLFCQDERQAEVKSLPKLVSSWVERTLGSNVAERTEFLKGVRQTSPLLMIATKFNHYLAKDDTILDGDTVKYEQMLVRWKRFGSALRNVAHIKGSSDSWFDNWTDGKPFQAIFPLRAFKYSQFSGLYTGYSEKNDVIISHEEARSEDFDRYFKELRKSFLDSSSDFIQMYFKDPEETWEAVTEVGQDGSWPILNYLKDVADKMSSMREALFMRVLQNCFNQLVNSLLKFYHDDNAAAELQKQRKTSSRISLSLKLLFGKDKDFFSDFIHQLVIDEAILHDVVLDTIKAIEVVEETDSDELFAVRESAGIDLSDSYETNLNRLMDMVACDSEEDLAQVLNEEFNLTIEQIIAPNKGKNIGIMIAEAIEEKWKENNLDLIHFEPFVARGFKEAQLMSLLDNISALFSSKIHMPQKMAKRLHPYVAGNADLENLADMIADICAHMVNMFVTTMGAEYYSEEDWNALEQTKEQLNLKISLHKDQFQDLKFDAKAVRESLPELFSSFDAVDSNGGESKPKQSSHMSNWIEFQQWTDLMEVSFLATTGIPTYNVEMNNALRSVIQKYILDAPALQKSVRESKRF